MFIGEAPGAEEESKGYAFVGPSGKMLDKWIAYLGLDATEVYVTNVVKCRPPNNRDPSEDEIASCRPWLEKEIRELDPRLVVPLGRFARDVVSHMRGGLISEHKYGLALKHPAWYLRQGGMGTIPAAELGFIRRKLLGE